jgi:lipopolysaccharide transport system ATP-binding protein
MNSADVVLAAKNLSKRYWIKHERANDTLRDAVGHGLRQVWHRLGRRRRAKTSEEFWALREVNFEIGRGEVVGIIGRNGAGKSTLLKILSRITEPSQGRIELSGRVASLLEVGTGFHPELTGRDNIYLNGAILGMSRAEITRKFDEIVAFAEVERFLDTPVKHYSSGMYVRLAFAVAAHLEPEILIVDEVLAVGDLEFQRKCLGKMEEVAGGGRTVLFVSHNMAAVQRLCSRGIYLQKGQVVADTTSAAAIDRYLADTSVGNAGSPLTYARRNPWLEVEKVEILVNGVARTSAPAGATVTFLAHYRCVEPARFTEGLECGFIVYGQGQKLVNFWSNAGLGRSLPVAARGTVSCTVPEWPFRSMPMTLQLHLNYRLECLVDLPEAVTFDSIDSDRFGTGIVPHSSEGILLLPHTWEAHE